MIELYYKNLLPKYIQVKESLRMLLESNAFSAGEQLPPVNVMASRLAINPRNLRWAYDELAKEGYIIINETGVFVAKKGEYYDKGQ